jgi:ABC-type multidrug transport system fused ATPase/permease subunit
MTAAPEAHARGGVLRLYQAMWRHARGRRHVLVGFLTLLFCAQLARLAIPYLFGEAVNALQTQSPDSLRQAARYVAMMVGAAVVAWALHGPGRVLERFSAVRIRHAFADELYGHVVGLPLRWHEDHHSGETLHRVSKSSGALFGFAQTQFIYLQSLVNLVGPLVALCFLSPVTGIAALVGYGAVTTLVVRIDGVMIRLAREENRAESRYTAALVDCLGNITTVLNLRLQAATRRLVRARLDEVSAPLRRSIVVNEVKWGTVDLLNTAMRSGLVVVYAALTYRATGSVLVGTAVMVYQYSQQIGNVVGSMASHWGDLVRYQTDYATADEILSVKHSKPTSPVRLSPSWREIRIDDLLFTHPRAPEGRPTLDRISLVLRRGERIALVGTSGSGKSSLMRVLAGVHPPERVTYGVDGVARPDLRDLSELAVVIPQDPEVFDATLEQNVTMGIDYPADSVWLACKRAGFVAVVDSLPEGLQTMVRERGLNLSGGQKQRLALSRGLLAARDASIVLLDEPTSNLDPLSEAAIYDALFAELEDACIVSAVHRLHLLPRFDTVVLLDGGRVVDAGTYDELVARQPRLRAALRPLDSVA